MTTRLYTNPIHLEHLTPEGHPERPERLRALENALERELFDDLDRVLSPQADESTVLLVHSEDHLAKGRKAIPEKGMAHIDASVLYCSTHQMPLFPGTGAKDEVGAGNIFNAPLSAQSSGNLFREAFRARILPALENMRPDLIIISAGFDAHHRDPLAEINLTEDDFDWATGKLMDIAQRCCDNRLVSLLEGGYDLVGLAESGASHINRLMRG